MRSSDSRFRIKTSFVKVSIITVVFNNEKTIAHAIKSVLSQNHPDIEYIIVDGKSTDGTLAVANRYKDKIATILSEPDKGLYDAINKGILLATGDIVGILNSDDFFKTDEEISIIAGAFEQDDVDAVFADVAFVRNTDIDKLVRLYSSRNFAVHKFARGYMPAHPSFYVRRELYMKYGLYKPDYKIAADYELLIRFLFIHKVKYKYLNRVVVNMRTGGVSNKNAYNIYLLNKEIVRACKENGISTNLAILSLKYFTKVFEFILPQRKSRQK